MDKHYITADDVKEIYEKVEGSKKGSFFIDNSTEKENSIIPNHVEEGVAKFFTTLNNDSTTKLKALKEDAKLARKLIEDII